MEILNYMGRIYPSMCYILIKTNHVTFTDKKKYHHFGIRLLTVLEVSFISPNCTKQFIQNCIPFQYIIFHFTILYFQSCLEIFPWVYDNNV